LKLQDLILKERVFDAALLIIGKVGRTFVREEITPFFIIGTGRSGTSLLVKIMDSNPNLSGFPGEANELWHPTLEPFESASIDTPPIEIDPGQFSKISLNSWPPLHRERIRDIFFGFHIISGRSKIFFSKSAMISFMIPEILKIYPNAKFIHIYRYGPSVVESYFKKNYGKYSRYVYTEEDYRRYCAKYWNACIMEIEDKKNELLLERKGQFLEFSYEDLCQKPKEILESLGKYIGIASDSFKFDISTISSQNYKAQDYTRDPVRNKLIELMRPGLILKDYLIGE
jgi:Sulfotransferase family